MYMKLLTEEDIVTRIQPYLGFELTNYNILIEQAELLAIATADSYIRAFYDADYELRPINFDYATSGIVCDLSNATSGCPLNDLERIYIDNKVEVWNSSSGLFTSDDRNLLLKNAILNITIYNTFLTTAPNKISETIANNYMLAIEFLKDINKQRVPISLKVKPANIDPNDPNYDPNDHRTGMGFRWGKNLKSKSNNY